MHKSPRILDMDIWEQVKEAVLIDASTIEDTAVISKENDYSTYPVREYNVLKGFKTWKPENLFPGIWDADNPVQQLKKECRESLIDCETGGLGLKFNIERFGIPYGSGAGEVAQFFATISCATDPFVVWHSPVEHNFPDLSMMDRAGADEEVVYRIECRDGDSTVYEVTYRKESEEVIAGGKPGLEFQDSQGGSK